MEKLTAEFKDSLIIDSSEIIGDYLELGIDTLFDNEVIKNIPIINTIIGTGKVLRGVIERNFMKNLIVFLNELNSGSIDQEKLKKYREELNNNPRKTEKELGRILIILEQTIDNEKISIFGKLYKAYINQIIDWHMLIEFTEITNRLYVNDIDTLLLIYKNQLSDTTNRNDLYRIERLNSLGIIGLSTKAVFIGSGNNRTDSYVSLNNIGKIYSNIIFNN